MLRECGRKRLGLVRLWCPSYDPVELDEDTRPPLFESVTVVSVTVPLNIFLLQYSNIFPSYHLKQFVGLDLTDALLAVRIDGQISTVVLRSLASPVSLVLVVLTF